MGRNRRSHVIQSQKAFRAPVVLTKASPDAVAHRKSRPLRRNRQEEMERRRPEDRDDDPFQDEARKRMRKAEEVVTVVPTEQNGLEPFDVFRENVLEGLLQKCRSSSFRDLNPIATDPLLRSLSFNDDSFFNVQ